jgi:hypothetical protein
MPLRTPMMRRNIEDPKEQDQLNSKFKSLIRTYNYLVEAFNYGRSQN